MQATDVTFDVLFANSELLGPTFDGTLELEVPTADSSRTYIWSDRSGNLRIDGRIIRWLRDERYARWHTQVDNLDVACLGGCIISFDVTPPRGSSVPMKIVKFNSHEDAYAVFHWVKTNADEARAAHQRAIDRLEVAELLFS